MLACCAAVAAFAPAQISRVARPVRQGDRGLTVVHDGKSNGLRTRIASVKNTKKITEAMRLVSAAKVRRAQEAVMQTRPFSETLQSVFSGLIQRLGKENLQLPLLEVRDVSKVLIVAISGDRGLCGSYNNYVIKKAEARMRELDAKGISWQLLPIGKKVITYFRRREVDMPIQYDCGQKPDAETAAGISETLLASYLAGECDSIELIYTKFVSLIASVPSIRTLVPLSPSGIESEGDEIYTLTTKGGDFALEKDGDKASPAEPQEFPRDMIFEQDPLQILNAILPLYLNGQILRTLQESVASELAARMQAMQSASDNAGELSKTLSQQYNRARQASVTAELLEIVAGAACVADDA